MLTRGRDLIGRLLRRKFVQDTLILQVGKVGTVLLSAITSLIIWRVLQPQGFGIYALAESFYGLWGTLDLTGVGAAFNTRLGIAIGEKNTGGILDLMAMSLKISFLMLTGLVVLIALLGAPIAEQIHGDPLIGSLAVGLGVAAVADGQYSLIMNSLAGRRYMRAVAVMGNINQLTLAVCTVGAVLIEQSPQSLLIGRLIYSYLTLGIAWWMYRSARRDEMASQGENGLVFPSLREVYRRAVRVPVRDYWRFGFVNAVDKNLSGLFIQISMQIVGAVGGAAAASYLSLALSGITQAGIFGAAVFENMQAIIPQAVGRRDFVALRRNFLRVLIALGIGGLALYGVLALVAPFVIPPILGDEWTGAIPPLIVLAIYGAVTTAGGVFGPLYRAFNRMRAALMAKITALVVVLPFGVVLIQHLGSQNAALGGAWMINGLFVVSVGITGVVMLRELQKRGRQD
jgi:O-antigen/teichoic acid export membrane protein